MNEGPPMTDTPAPRSTSMRCCEPATNTDKDYIIKLVQAPNPEEGWLVECWYGRHGKNLNQSLKTKKPVPFEKAEQVFNKEFVARLSKGYVVEGESNTATVAPPKESCGVFGQLLNPISEDEVEFYMTDPGWIAEEKHDGERNSFTKKGDTVVVGNRRGQVIPGNAQVVAELARHGRDFVIEGEVLPVTNQFIAFDLLELDGRDMRGEPHGIRAAELRQLIALDDVTAKALGHRISYARAAVHEMAKWALLSEVRAKGGEGLVFKRANALHVAGKNHKDQVKLKLWADCSCVVSGINEKSSVRLEMYDDKGQPVDVGNVTIPQNRACPEVGDVVDVQYLYAYRQGSLFQPVFRGVRTDVAREECTTSTLKYYAGPKAGENPAPGA
ncbi:RNA ligase family protein [Gluconobacter potus]|nr:RNA ligase family protein [Gluconobacter potus]